MQIKDDVFLFLQSLASASWRALEEERGEGSVEHGSNPLLDGERAPGASRTG